MILVIIRNSPDFGKSGGVIFRPAGHTKRVPKKEECRMCKTGAFLWGLAAGMVASAMIEIVVLPRPRPRKTAVGKAMQRMGNAMDQALESVAEKMS